MIKVLALEDDKYASLYEIHKLKIVEINDLETIFKTRISIKKNSCFYQCANKMKKLIGNEKCANGLPIKNKNNKINLNYKQ